MSATQSSVTRFTFNQKRIEQLPPHPAEARATEAEYTDTEVAGLKLLVSKSGRKFFYWCVGGWSEWVDGGSGLAPGSSIAARDGSLEPCPWGQ